MITAKKFRVLVVDDSAVVRRAIADALSKDPELEVVGTASDPYVARDKILELRPDVITLDIEMPRMDGLTFLKVLQKHHPVRAVIISSTTTAGSKAAVEALAAGAIDVIAKPTSAWSLGELRDRLAQHVKAAATARLRIPSASTQEHRPSERISAGQFHPRQVIVLGASTGGTEAIKSVLTQLPDGLPGICIVQHIPAGFSKAFAERLDQCCALEVREAAHGDEVKPGVALIAPGDYHMSMVRRGDSYRVCLDQKPPRHHTRPSVDVLFETAAECAGNYALCVLLTGMGSDGALGMKTLKERGAITIAESEDTCVVYGMPKEAADLGVVDHVLPLNRVPQGILTALRERTSTSFSKPTSINS